jgi:ubiquinone/menaquinone biosynthesis C-methylase UbiE
MSNMTFKLMTAIMKAIDFVNPHQIDKRIKTFDITPGMIIVDYGCGPARYTLRYAKLVGDKGKVYAVDIQELAIKAVQKKIEKNHLSNVEAKLANGYNSGLPDHIADRVTVLDMFFMIPDPIALLKELNRITKKNGVLIIDEGHQSRESAKQKIQASGAWEIIAETKDHLTYRPREGY